MNDAAIIGCSVVRGSVHKHGYGHKQAAAAPIVAGGSEAGDCGSKPGASVARVARRYDVNANQFLPGGATGTVWRNRPSFACCR
jgi:hypothetical protein